MPTLDWLQNAFSYGYDSGNILSLIPNLRRLREEIKIGGSYRRVFRKAILPYIRPESTVLELGPGAGSWSRAILKYIPHGILYTIDFQDAARWLRPDQYNGRLVCYQVNDNSFSCIEHNSIDFFWSFGVLCHNNIDHIKEIMKNALPKMKRGGIACHQYGDWEKLDSFGWQRGRIPLDFKNKPDDEIVWPRNSQTIMKKIVEETGWVVLSPDLGLVKRDALILLKRM